MRVVVLTACATVLAAPHAMAADTTPTGTNPAEQLWRAYPLEQTATTSGQPAVPPTRSTTGGSPKTSGRAAGDDTPWLALVLAAAGIGIVAALAVVGARRRSRRPRPSPAVVSTPRAAAAAVEDSAPRAAAAEPAPGASGANGDTAARPPSAPEAEPIAIPAPPTDPSAAPPPAQTQRRPSPSRKGERTAPRGKNAAAAKSPSANSGGRDPAGTGKPARGPICQIRWLPKGRGSCFAAVMPDGDGVERTLATSPTVQWRAATPPEQSPEAQAALRQLSKTLRDGGWRAMRTKGKDFDEPQWYARRFRLQVPAAEGPTATEDPGASTTGPPRAASGRTRQAASRPR